MKMFLFVTANSNEEEAFKKYYKVTAEQSILGKKYFFGRFGLYDAAYIHLNEQGSTHPEATLLLGELIRVLRPIAIVMVGIAFGADDSRQKIGDVLISKRILPYDSQKILDEGTQYKETPKDAGFHLVNAFSSLGDWKFFLDEKQSAAVYIGAILTGSRLVDSYRYRTKLLQDFKEYAPIGGEMEAYGIYSECRIHGISEWIIVKGICDWGYKKQNPNKELDQKKAANAAVDYCHKVFSTEGIFSELISQENQSSKEEQVKNSFSNINNGNIGKQYVFSIDTVSGDINL